MQVLKPFWFTFLMNFVQKSILLLITVNKIDMNTIAVRLITSDSIIDNIGQHEPTMIATVNGHISSSSAAHSIHRRM